MNDLRAIPPAPSSLTRPWVLTVGHAFLAIWWALLAVRVIPAFTEMFASFGAQLPVWTRLAVGPWWARGWLVVDVLAMGIAWVPAGRRVAWVALVLSGAAILATGVALYLPIFEMGRNLEP